MMRFAPVNKAREAAVSVHTGTENVLYPIQNIAGAQPHPEARVRASGSGEIVVRFDFHPAAPAIRGGILLDFTGGYTVKLAANSSDNPATAGGATEYPLLWDGRRHYAAWVSSTGRRYWYLKISGLPVSTYEFRLPMLWLLGDAADEFFEIGANITLSSAARIRGGRMSQAVTRGGNIVGYRFGVRDEAKPFTWQAIGTSAVAALESLHDICFGGGCFALFDWNDAPRIMQYTGESMKIDDLDNGLYNLTMEAIEVLKPEFGG